MKNSRFTSAVILAAGMGSRMRAEVTKQRMTVLNKSVLLHTLLAFDKAELVDEIVVVAREDEMEFVLNELSNVKKTYKAVVGGDTRRESAQRGFCAIAPEAEFAAIHDAARCLITPDDIDAVIKTAHLFGAATAVAPVNDTVKMIDEQGNIVSTVPRTELRLAGTPQVFRRDIYEAAVQSSCGAEVTDDNMMVEATGVPIRTVETGNYNIKITTREDLDLAEYILGKRLGDE